jgi:hypothetical protein
MRYAGDKMGGGFTGFLTDQQDFGMMGENNIQNRYKETAAGIEGEGMVNQYGLKSIADVLAAKYGAQATKAAGAAEGQASMVSGLTSGISSAFGGFMRSPGMGGTPKPTPTPAPVDPLAGW